MASCEHCWDAARSGENSSPADPLGYNSTLRRAEAEGWPCTDLTEEGARLRAGQFWDEATKSDTRLRAPSTTGEATE